jgi:2-polyprenyl-3-methyl-5-hydroxy-6-metoxy-1,4-benzoquinol methylase
MPIQRTWENYSRSAEARGTLVLHLLSARTGISGKQVLDFGSGVGGTAYVFDRHGARVTAADVTDSFRFSRQRIDVHIGPTEPSTFAAGMFDIVIMQDVIEHLTDAEFQMKNVAQWLKPDGLLYLSTPNRWSPLNLIADPHWGVPLVAVLSRRCVKWLMHDFLKIDPRDRTDWPALLSFDQLKTMLHSTGFTFGYCNRQVVDHLCDYPESVLCAPWHLWLFDMIKKVGLHRALRWLVNDTDGIFNRFLNPTWFIIASKQDRPIQGDAT